MSPLELVSISGLHLSIPNGAAARESSAPDAAKWVRGLAGSGQMGALIRAFDWSKTPLGPIEEWPSSLLAAVRICLQSRFQLAIYWGPQLVLLYNDAEREILGAMHPRVLGMPAAAILTEMWDVVGPMLRAVLEGGPATWSVDQALRLNRHGFVEEAFFTYSYSPIADGDGVGGVLLVSFETTDRVLAERRLRTLRELAAESAKAECAVEACTRAARVLAGNQSDLPFSLIYLTDRDGKPLLCASTGVAGAPELALSLLPQLPAGHEAIRLEELFSQFPPGESLPSRAALVLPIAQAGQPNLGYLVAGTSDLQVLDEAYRGFFDLVAAQIATSIAGARALEEERARAKALAAFDAAKTTFFANVSHEFRTPLSLLLAPLEDSLSQPGNPLSPADRQRLTIAHRNGVRLLKLVNTLLEFSRIEAGRIQAALEPIDLSILTAELASMFRSAVERAGLRLVVDCPPLSRPGLVDRDMWEKIVFNLLSNAFKCTLEGEIRITLRQVGSEAELSVSDTGVGIPSEELPRLFGRFHQIRGVRARATEGTGIGLALVQELVKLQGGSIRVQSVCGRGSTFAVSVPLARASLTAERDPAPPPPGLRAALYVAEASGRLVDPRQLDPAASASLGGRNALGAARQGQDDAPQIVEKSRVLVADDNADMRQYLAGLLAGAYEVDEVADGRAALAAARERPPDLVLADVMMPGLDGFGLVRELRADARTRTVPVVLLSARAGEESRVEGLAAGADDYLVKPFGARELMARVGAHLELARVRREATRRESELRAEVRQAQEQAAAILESITDGFLALDSDWRFTHVNSEAERINGIRREDHIGRTQWELFPATRGTVLEFEWRRAVAEKVAVEFENYYEPWDTWFHIKAYPSKDGGLSVFFHDITPRKRSEDALRKAHDKLEEHVRERTRELSLTNGRLMRQVAKRKQVEQARTELMRRLAHAQEEEHRRIARELHDDLTQRLAVLAIDAGILEQLPSCSADVEERARGLREQLAALSEGVHSLSRQLHPSILDELGIVDALRAECLSLDHRDGIRVRFLVHDIPAGLSREMALCVYRVTQEALRNVARHAKTRRASVRLFATDRHVIVCVRDRGVGFDIAARGKLGLGLESMRERARLVRARLSVASRLGDGTMVTLRVPLHRSRA